MANDRDCENCKHHKEVCKNGIFYHSCETWDCEFEPKEDEEFEPKEDAISRQAVINHICEGKDCYKENCKGVLFNRCPDITWVNELPPVNPHEPCEDAIRRQAVLNTLENMDRALDEDRTVENYKELLRECYKVLPSVNPQKPICPSAGVDCEDCPAYEPKTGHWIYDKNIENWRCSECGETPKTLGYCGTADFMAEHFKYCNHCGAKMTKSEQKPKSEWQHDHEILRAYSDGASAVLDKIRAEIDTARFVDKDTKHCRNANATGLEVALDIIDKYKAESEET